jgi:uncharacterized membrane protein
MQRQAIKNPRNTAAGLVRMQPAFAVAAAICWAWVCVSIASRIHLVMGYTVIATGPAYLEPFLASHGAWWFAFAMISVWLGLYARRRSRGVSVTTNLRAITTLTLACVPLFLLWMMRIFNSNSQPLFAEALWLSVWTGISFGGLLPMQAEELGATPPSKRWGRGGIVLLVVATSIWWFWQSSAYYSDFLLGYNDFGHFTQRIANTVAGRGWLLETPVLPRFWDHFNPGILLLAPLWSWAPSNSTIFAVQAISLASGAVLVWALAKHMQFGSLAACLWSAAWLTQPALGQMNLAYTYGWHPISLAIPLLLAALVALMAGRRTWTVVLGVVAMCMEEGVIVVVSLFCAVNAAICWMANRSGSWRGSLASEELQLLTGVGSSGVSSLAGAPPREPALSVAAVVWASAAAISIAIFLGVYRWSGLAEFQTGRFVALGDSLGGILLSPVLRPEAFWGQIFRWDKIIFLACLWIPCGLMNLLRGWRWLLPTFVPLAVLVIWDHKPATCLAFQYPSSLLPLFWLAALVGSQRAPARGALTALAGSLTLSLCVGQMPYSSPTLLDVIGQTYGSDAELRRKASDEDGKWLTNQLHLLDRQTSVLATGRIAAHMVGHRDIETVGQYLERREKLTLLDDRLNQPILFYDWIVLDHREQFQQSPSSTLKVQEEAMAVGFSIYAAQYDIVILQRP